MPNHFACIGLGVGGEGDLESVVQPLFGKAVESAPPTREHHHLRWTDSSGAGIAFHLTSRSELQCLAPCFVPPDGGTRWRVHTSVPTPDPGCVHCGGVECDVLGEDDSMVTRAAVQLMDFVPYREWLRTERTWELQVAAFAHEADFFQDEAAFNSWQAGRFGGAKDDGSEPMRLAPCCFLPMGMFGEPSDMGQRACSMMAGTVETCSEQRNTMTDGRYLRVRLRTLPGAVDVVMPMSMAKTGALPGSLAMVTAWFIGRPVEPPPPATRGLLSRIFGRN